MMIVAALALTVAGDTVNHKVKIDGKTYRVEVKGRTFEAFDKSIFTGQSPERGEKLRQAVRQATGCAIKDEYWVAAHLTGLLVCDQSPAS